MTYGSTKTAAVSSPQKYSELGEVAPGLGETLGHSLIERIGNTPLLRLNALTRDLPGIALLGKAEWYNPGGSVKDRAAANIVAQGRRKGLLRPGKILLDATSGNTGIAYAMLGAAEGFPVTLCMPENVSRERKQIVQGYGANILYTDPADGSDGAIRMARELASKHPDQYFYADQYSNDANWKAHYSTTANEIWQQTQGRVTHFVSMLGTSGTFVGTTRRLKELNPAVKCVSLQPDSSFHGIEGAKHMASAIVPKIYDRNPGRSESRDLHRRRLRHGAPALPHRRIAGGNFSRRRGRGMPEDCAGTSAHRESGGGDCHDPLRLRR